MVREGPGKAVLIFAVIISMVIPLSLIQVLSPGGETSAYPTRSGGNVLEVGTDKPYSSVNEALLEALAGDTILIHAGTYVERLVIEKSVTIMGIDERSVVIDGSEEDCTISVFSDHVTIIDLTIRNSGLNERSGKSGGVAYDAGIWISARYLNVINCTFKNNSRTSIFFDYQGDYTSIHGCTFHGPTMNHIRFGTDSVEYVSIVGNDFSNDVYQIVFYGPYLVENLIIVGNRFTDDGIASGLKTTISFNFWWDYDKLKHVVVANNYIEGGNVGVRLNAGNDIEIAYNTIRDCNEYGIKVSTSRDVRIHHNNFLNCSKGKPQGNNTDMTVDWNLTNGSGNYWSDYEGRYPNATNDGTHWNQPYKIDSSMEVFDHSPLVNMVEGEWESDLGPVVKDPLSPFRVRRDSSFEIDIGVIDMDTPKSELDTTVVSGPEWLDCRNGGILSGFVPLEERIGLFDAVVTISDGTNEVTVNLSIDVLPEQALVGHWTFSENTSMVTSDESGYENHGELRNDASWFPGLQGTAVRMDGDTDHIECGSDDSLDISAEYSILLCVYPENSTNDDETLITKGMGSYYSDGWMLSLNRGDGGKIRLRMGGGDPHSGIFESEGTIDNGQWTHIAITFDGEIARIYLNGELDTEGMIDITLPINQDPFILGEGRYQNDGLIGIMDEVMIYNFALEDYYISYQYDGLRTEMMSYRYPTEPYTSSDDDEDSLPDNWEIDHFGDRDEGPAGDFDGDGYTNYEEYYFGTDPTDSNDPYTEADSDHDGLPDSWEMEHFGDLDQDQHTDFDHDGFTDLDEYNMGSDPVNRNDPFVEEDPDDDGLPNEWELIHFGSLDEDPTGDHDDDGYSNLDEYRGGTDPTDPDDFPEVTPDDPPSDMWWIILMMVFIIIFFVAVVIGLLFLVRSRGGNHTEVDYEEVLEYQDYPLQK